MADGLEKADLNISEVLPWEEFVESIRDLRTMCMIHGVLNTPIMLLNPSATNKYFHEEPELLQGIFYADRTPLIGGQFNEVPEYRTRMIDGLLELHDRIVG